MSVQMLRSAQRATAALPIGARRCTVVSRRCAVVTAAKASFDGASTDPVDVANYLKTLPGYGPVSGPFENPWDPANLCDGVTVNEVRRWRESEIVHGRVAMLAALGFIVGEQVQDSQLLFNFDGQVSGPAIMHFQQLKQGFWEPLLIAIGLAESFRTSVGWSTPLGAGFNTLKDEYTMGDLGFDPLGLGPKNAKEMTVLKTKELNNGRLAMIAIAGFVLQEKAEPGIEIFEHLFFNLGLGVAENVDGLETGLGLPATIPIPTL